MDAAQTLLKNTALIAAAMFLAVAPGHAQTQLSASPTSVALTGTSTFAQVIVGGTGNFTVNVPSPTFFSVSPTSGTAPNATLTIQLVNTSCAISGGTCSSSFTIHPTQTNGGNDVTVPVTFTSGSGGGGGGNNGVISANPNSVTLTPANGQSASASIALTTTSSTPISYNTTLTPANSWLSIFPGNNPISSTNGATITILANPTGFTSTQTGTVTVTPTNGGAATTISVTMQINGTGTGSSSYSLSPNSVNFQYPSGQQQQTVVVFNNANQTTFNVTVLNCNSSNFLLVNGGTSLFSQSVANGLNLTLNTAVASGMSTGTYSCQAVVQNPSNSSDQTAVTVTLSVNGGGGGGGATNYALNPSSVSFVSPLGSTNTQTTSVTVTSSVATTYNATFTPNNGGNWLILNGIGQTVTNQPVPSLTLSLNNPQTFVAGSYSGTVTITNPNGSGSASLSVSLTVGSSSSSYTINPNTLTFGYPFGTQSGSISIASSTQSQFVATASTQSGGNWLGVSQGSIAGSSLTGQVSQGLIVYLNLSGVPSNAGTYFGQVTISNPSNSGDNTVISVTLQQTLGGSGGGTGVSPTSLSFSTNAGVAPAAQNVSITLPSGVSSFSATINGSPQFVSNPCNGCGYSGSQSMPIQINPGNLTTGSYTNTITFSANGSTLGTVTVNLTINGSGGTGGGTSTVAAPTSLNFYYQTGTANPQYQTILVNGSGTFTATSNQPSWLVVNPPTGTAPGNVFVSVIPQSFSAGTNNSGQITITSSAGTTSVNVNLTVTSGAVLSATPGSIYSYYTAGSGSSQQATLQVTTSDGSTPVVTASSNTSWISVGSPSPSGNQTAFLVTMTPSGLCNGLNTGTISVSASGVANNPLSVPVVVLVSGSTNSNCGSSSGTLTLSPTSLTLSSGSGSTATVTATVSVTTPNSGTTFNVTTSTNNGGGWLSISSPCNACNLTGNTNLTVAANPSGLPTGTYTGNVILTTNGVAQQVPVTFNVGTSGGSGNLTVTNTNGAAITGVSFTASLNGTSQTQQINITSASGSSGVGFTLNYSTQSGGNWLSASAAGLTLTNGQGLVTPIQPLTVSANPAGLPAGTYNGTITLSPNGGSQVTLNVAMTVQQNTVSATPSSLTFNYQAGSSTPSAQTVTVSGGASLNFTATAVTSTGGSWLSVSPTSGTTGASGTTLSVSVNPGTLGTGTYTGTITVAGASGATGSTTINVTLNVTAPLPTISQVSSAASYIGQSISPGEIIVIFGTGLGPTPLVSLTLDSSGKVTTTLGGVQVFVNGIAAPMIYASNTQVAAVVPYDIAPLKSATVYVKFLGQTSNVIGLSVTPTQPGIFTANASGTGPGAILNTNFSPNSPGNPAAKGSVVSIYMTGEGVTSPASVNGGVTQANLPAPQVTPAPLLPVAVTVDGSPVAIQYAGEAPGLVAGVLQVNVVIPATARTGDLPLVVSIGGVQSQTGVTVSVR